MKERIIRIEEDWMAVMYGVIGLLLIIFPEMLTKAIPYLLGIGMILQGIFGGIGIIKYKHESEIKIGKVIINLVLGIATLFHSAEAIGAIGAIWAMKTLEETSDEITESFENKKFSVIRMIFAAITIALAILLLFDPFEHFEFHVRILGLEMISYVFVRDHRSIAGFMEQQMPE